MIKEEILKILIAALKKIGIDEVPELQHPSDMTHGDYASNVALKWSKKLKKNPMELAEEIKKAIKQSGAIEKVTVEKPGFLNFYLSEKTLLETLATNQEMKKTGKTILLEYGQPNTHKVPHIGHLFSYLFGESLARLLTASGNYVIRANYQGDIGPHVAKCLYIVQKKKNEIKELVTLKAKVNFLQRCYQEGSKVYEKDEKVQKEIDLLNQAIYNKDPHVTKLWEETRSWSVEFYKEFERSFGITYDRSYFESEISDIGKEIVKKNVGKIFKESEGAIIFEGEPYKLHTRVFLTKHGTPTYEAKDLGLITKKKEEFKFDLSLVTTANEQTEYWKVIQKVSELIYPDLVGKLKHLGYGMIRLASGKMSSRTGEIIDAFSLVEKVESEIKTEYETDADTTRKVAHAAIAYSFLNSGAYTNMVFDLEKSIAKEGNSGPYLLYSYVRTRGIVGTQKEASNIPSGAVINEEEKTLLRLLSQFQEVIEKASHLYSPHLLATYLYQLAQSFNFFYQKHSVLKAEEKLKELRLGLTQAVGRTLKEGLHLLGIETVEKM